MNHKRNVEESEVFDFSPDRPAPKKCFNCQLNYHAYCQSQSCECKRGKHSKRTRRPRRR